MNILVIAKHVITDPQRKTYYNSEIYATLINKGIINFFNKGMFVDLLNIIINCFIFRISYKKWKVDMIVSDNPRIGIWVGVINLLTFCRKKHVIWNFNIRRKYKGIKLVLSKIAFMHVKAFIVYSRHEVITYSQMLGIPQSKFIFKLLSGPYLEDERYTSLMHDCIKDDYIVCAGYSGRDFVLLSKVAAKLPDNRFIVLAYPEFIGNIVFTENVEVVSMISEVEYCKYIANAKLSFLPIVNKETANGQIAIIQSMCFKTLLLTNITAGTKDYLMPGSNCMIFNDNNTEETVSLISELLNDYSCYDYIIEEAFKFATENFKIEHEIKILESI